MERTISGMSLWALCVDPDYAYLSPELREAIASRESDQSGETDESDWVARQYRRIG